MLQALLLGNWKISNKRGLNMHSSFFSSLKQVEKRLKLESSLPQTEHLSLESLSSPLFLHTDHLHNHNSVANQCLISENSEIPVEFLSNSIEFPQTHENPPPESLQNDPENPDCVENEVDEIGLLVELLGLSIFEGDGSQLGTEEKEMTCVSCHCEGGFYDKIVGVKGPKCGKEMERLEGWVKHFRREKIEPFRLAHMLLAKATCIVTDDDGDGIGSGFQGVEFPSTVEEFLWRDPPTKSKDEERSDGFVNRSVGLLRKLGDEEESGTDYSDDDLCLYE